jgi:hypothetical protein
MEYVEIRVKALATSIEMANYPAKDGYVRDHSLNLATPGAFIRLPTRKSAGLGEPTVVIDARLAELVAELGNRGFIALRISKTNLYPRKGLGKG